MKMAQITCTYILVYLLSPTQIVWKFLFKFRRLNLHKVALCQCREPLPPFSQEGPVLYRNFTDFATPPPNPPHTHTYSANHKFRLSLWLVSIVIETVDLRIFVTKFDNGALLVLHPESFCAENLSICKALAFSDSAVKCLLYLGITCYRGWGRKRVLGWFGTLLFHVQMDFFLSLAGNFLERGFP